VVQLEFMSKVKANANITAEKMEGADKNSSKLHLEKIFIKQGQKIIPINTRNIFFVKSQGKYLAVHLKEKKHLVRGSLKVMQNKLDPSMFFRIHRSHIVNMEKIKFIEPLKQGGDYKVELVNGQKLRLSRRYRRILDAFSISD